MRASPFLVSALTCLTLAAQAEVRRSYRQWIAGQEVGGALTEVWNEGGGREVRSRDWIDLQRLGTTIGQELTQTARRSPDGSMTFTWRLQLSKEPFEGHAEWSPKLPTLLRVTPRNGPPKDQTVPEGAILWPEDLDRRLEASARSIQPIRVVTFSFPLQQWSSLELEPAGRDPLPGYPDTVHFVGAEVQGGVRTQVEVWISPSVGEVKQTGDFGGLSLLTQRSELPPPRSDGAPSRGFFEQTLQTLPPHPFLVWLREVTVKAEGKPPVIPENAQQQSLPDGRWRLSRAALPTVAEGTQAPVSGSPSAEDSPFLAPSPLVPFKDPAFDGLVRRLGLPAGLSRWELAKRVTSFVYEWITEKDFTVGFASALEVARNPRGDCTEHGVLAVALLRRLGVPARGVTGWVALEGTLGLHFWVEVNLKGRWLPVDPTFDQAPASAFRIKLGDSDLADLGSVAWEGASLSFSKVKWTPILDGAGPWGTGVRIEREVCAAPDGTRLRLPGGTWALRDGLLSLRGAGGQLWTVEASVRPSEAQLKDSRKLSGARTLREGWWDPSSRQLWIPLHQGRWLRLGSVTETAAYLLLDQLMAEAGTS